jgi:hypothetical protein
MKRSLGLVFANVFLAMFLVSCGGGSGDSGLNNSDGGDPGTPPPGGNDPGAGGSENKITCDWVSHGIEGTGRNRRKGIVRSVSEDGTVVIDDIEYATLRASIVVNGSCATLLDLGRGDVVTVFGDVDDQTRLGDAEAIFVEYDVAGDILALDSEAGTLNVVGQNVIVDGNTVFGDTIQPATLATLGVWEQVAISGLVNESGVLIASRIERWPSRAAWQVAGRVSHLDASRHMFRVNDVRVRYANSEMVGFPSNRLVEGQFVRVQGGPLWILEGFPCCEPEDGGIDAAAIEYIDYLSGNPLTFISGPVTRWSSASDFEVAGAPVVTDGSTRQVGVDLASVAGSPDGYWLTVAGHVDARKRLDAKVVVAGYSGSMQFNGPITAVNPETRVVEVATIPVLLNSWAILRSREGSTQRDISFGDLTVGDELEVLGDFVNSYGGSVSAVRAIQGPPSQVVYTMLPPIYSEFARPYFTLAAGERTLTVETNSETRYFWGHTMPPSGCSCRSTSADDFWSLPNLSAVRRAFTSTEVVGKWMGDRIVAEKIYWMEE